MQETLKSVFRRSSKSRKPSGSNENLGNGTHHGEASPPRTDGQRMSSDRRGRTSVDSSATGSVHTGRSRPVSSIYNDTLQSQAPSRQTATSDFMVPTDPNSGAIANDYKAYLPVLSPVTDDHGDDYIGLHGDREYVHGQHVVSHEENVADRNIARYGTSIDGGSRDTARVTHNSSAVSSPTVPISILPSTQVHSRKQPAVTQSSGATLESGLTDGLVRNNNNYVTTNRSLVDSARPQGESAARAQALVKTPSFHPKAGHAQPVLERKKLNTLNSDNESHSGVLHATVDWTAHGEETALARKLREDGVADLRNTVDTDGDITWSPAITHEVIKPHQHEIVQQKIYRETHNYEHFHRIQPVMVTEVLPPRHWIPNPSGEGLIEISADELPARTGDKRWWSICEHSSPYSRQTALPTYRTEPEIIEAGIFMTEQGFERKETIIIHPPTLADLTGYSGPVQAMHFDHRTGKSWTGELTTMDKLHELQKELDQAPDSKTFRMDGLDRALPDLPPDTARTSSPSMPYRKPVGGLASPVHGAKVRRTLNSA